MIAVDRLAAKMRHARVLGADEALNVGDLDVVAAVRDLTFGLGAHCVVDTVGSAVTLQTGTDVLGHGGRLVILGYTQERGALDPRRMAVNELEILGTRSVAANARSMRSVWLPIAAGPRLSAMCCRSRM